MTIQLAFASVASGAPLRTVTFTGASSGTLAAPRCPPAGSVTPVVPHVDQTRSALPGPATRIDDALFALAIAVLLVAVGLPWPSALSLLA